MKELRYMFVLAAAMLLSVGMASAAMLAPFTQDELDDNWVTDRQFPSGGVESVSAFGREDVARLGIDNTNTQPGTFQRTEGIKTVGTQDFGTSVQVDLYLDPEWADTAVRAGLWVVGDDGEGVRDERFGILEFVNLESSTSGESAQGDHTGWRIWDSTTGWTNIGDDYAYGDWFTLGIELDTTNAQYLYTINGEQVGTATGGTNFISELFLNSYNYGLDVFPNLNSDSHAAHWHVGVEEPANPQSRMDCMRGGWEDFEFRNQGQCIRFVNTGQDSR